MTKHAKKPKKLKGLILMTYQIGQIPTTVTAVRQSDRVEIEQPAGPTGAQSTAGASANPYLDLIAQVTDAGGSDVAEVEANTKALRATYRACDLTVDENFSIGRYRMGIMPAVISLTTAGITDKFVAGIQWAWNGFVVIRRIEAGLSTGAVSGTRTGVSKISLFNGPLANASGTGKVYGVNAGSQNPRFRTSAMLLPLAYVSTDDSGNGAGFAFLQGAADSNPLATIEGGCLAAAGSTPIPMQTLWQSRPGEQPIVIQTGGSIVMSITHPAAGTSQTVQPAFNITWEEWVPYNRYV